MKLYGFFIHCAALSNEKAKLWVNGRKNWESQLKQNVSKLETGKRIWVHCASYGEFEQGRPLLDAMLEKNPHIQIILTFFSPSGYEAFKNWRGAKIVMYLPQDSAMNATRFLDIIQPDLAIFVKYEFWVNFLQALKKKKIETYLISAVFKPHHPFFKWYGNLFIDSLSAFKLLFIQDSNSARLLEQIGIKNYLITGDTRFDRVIHISHQHIQFEILEVFAHEKPLIIAGSTWPEDEKLLLEAFLNLDIPATLVLAPHQVDEKSIEHCMHRIQGHGLSFVRYSQFKGQIKQVLIIDQIGLLSRVYSYASMAYVGGGLGDGLHNILEPAVFGIPIAVAEKNPGKYNESVELMALDVVKNVNSSAQLVEVWRNQLTNLGYRQQCKERLQGYFELNGNVTRKILDKILL